MKLIVAYVQPHKLNEVKQDIIEVSSSSGTSFRGDLVAHLRDGSKVRIRPNIEGLDHVVSGDYEFQVK